LSKYDVQVKTCIVVLEYQSHSMYVVSCFVLIIQT